MRLARTYCAGSTGRSAGRVNTRVQECKSARALKRESTRAQERLRGRKEGINVWVRCEKGRMMWKQGSVEQMADERCGWRIGRKARRRESKKVLGAKSYST